MDYDEDQQVISFISAGNQPNCVALLLKNGQIFHCVFIPSPTFNLEPLESTTTVSELL